MVLDTTLMDQRTTWSIDVLCKFRYGKGDSLHRSSQASFNPISSIGLSSYQVPYYTHWFVTLIPFISTKI
ncbi:uncharacterized protein N7483_002260 [Penicillium malachiteum]|uniref:uncharacterized protein n=1 Tax=Penicillium malachiteum TaxID=1324776 RepID=UPI002546E041|nr:uncharacterized protein N7483_002260 [Penicillium malachiteum]KAJ5737135.1 hypothetical protein N7483_002260 [Penicillium malachiteum]